VSELLHIHRCGICWGEWKCEDLACGEGIIETRDDMQFLADCGIEQQELSRHCEDCLSDPAICETYFAPDPYTREMEELEWRNC
jgi:hypothetical protein